MRLVNKQFLVDLPPYFIFIIFYRNLARYQIQCLPKNVPTLENVSCAMLIARFGSMDSFQISMI